MNRTYHRGKTVDTNQWCYGKFIPTPSGRFGYIDREQYFNENNKIKKSVVDLKTVTKSSPYRDTSSRRIFEYDIVEFKDKNDNVVASAVLYTTAVVGVEKWVFQNLDTRNHVNIELCLRDRYIRRFVVGNIYDTPIDENILIRIYSFVSHKILVEDGFVCGRHYHIFNDGARTHIYISTYEKNFCTVDYENLIYKSVESGDYISYCGNCWWNENFHSRLYCIGWVYETIQYLNKNIDASDELSREEITKTNEKIKEDIVRVCKAVNELWDEV